MSGCSRDWAIALQPFPRVYTRGPVTIAPIVSVGA